MLRLSAFFIFFVGHLCFGGVERFIKPSTIKQAEKKVSAYLANVANEYHANELKQLDVPCLLNAEMLEDKLGELLEHRYQVDGEVSVSLTRDWASIEVGQNFIIKLNSCSPDELSSNAYIRFSLWEKGAKLGDFSIPIKVAHLKEVYFTKKSLLSGMRLHEDLFNKCKVDVLKQHINTVQSNANLASFESSTSLRANSPLKWSNLSKVTLINKGKVIDVFASGNGIFVTMKGLALEDGVEGSFVKVRNLSSDKEFLAKVLNENSVKVHL